MWCIGCGNGQKARVNMLECFIKVVHLCGEMAKTFFKATESSNFAVSIIQVTFMASNVTSSHVITKGFHRARPPPLPRHFYTAQMSYLLLGHLDECERIS